MGDVDSSVDDVAASALAGSIIINIGSVSLVYVGDTTKTPGSSSVGLPGLAVNFGVLLDPFDLLFF